MHISSQNLFTTLLAVGFCAEANALWLRRIPDAIGSVSLAVRSDAPAKTTATPVAAGNTPAGYTTAGGKPTMSAPQGQETAAPKNPGAGAGAMSGDSGSHSKKHRHNKHGGHGGQKHSSGGGSGGSKKSSASKTQAAPSDYGSANAKPSASAESTPIASVEQTRTLTQTAGGYTGTPSAATPTGATTTPAAPSGTYGATSGKSGTEGDGSEEGGTTKTPTPEGYSKLRMSTDTFRGFISC